MQTSTRLATLLLAGALWLGGCAPTEERPATPDPKAPPPPASNSQQIIDDERARQAFELEAAKADTALRQARELGVGSDKLNVMPLLAQAAAAAEDGDYAAATRLVRQAQAQAEAAAEQARKSQRK